MKIKRLFLSLVMLISCLCMVSCGKKQDSDNSSGGSTEPTKQNSIISADIDRRLTWYVGDKLKNITLYSVGENCTEGNLAWENEEYVLVSGDNVCKWIFTPTNTNLYNSKTGTITISAENPKLEPEVTDVQIVFGDTIKSIYKGAKLSTVGLTCSTNVSDGYYKIEWLNPDETFSESVKTYKWLFTPTDSNFKQKIGTITLDDSVEMQDQYLDRIEFVSCSKTSGYKAFDTFECSGLTINEIYNAGKVVPVQVDAKDCTIGYVSDTCLHQGDTQVTITYKLLSCTATIEQVGYFIIPKPSQTSDVLFYTGTPQKLNVETSVYYSVESKFEEDAGKYDVTLTIEEDYRNDCRWAEDDDSLTTTVKCEIKKVDLVISANEYTGNYDGDKHSSSVSGVGVDKIYYSLTELTEENYQDTSIASETPIEFENSGTYTVYYFAKGDKNHNNKTGAVQVKINPIIPTMSVRNCYSLYTGSAINYPSEYVTIVGANDEILQNGELEIEYYSNYSQEDGLSIKLNSAPTSVKSSEYYVLVKYSGDGKNYGETQAIAKLFIDNVDNGLYSKAGEAGFAFKDDVYTVTEAGYSITGSNQECDAYVEFSVLPINNNGIIEIAFSSKFYLGNQYIQDGKLIYDGGYVLLCDDGTKYNFELAEDKNSISVSVNNVISTLEKWEFPDYFGTYTAQTVADEDYDEIKNHGTKNTEIEVFNDHGTIRFIARVNVKVISGVSSTGGYTEWKGVVKCGIESDENRKRCFVLNCYVTGSDDGYSDKTQYFQLVWLINDDSNVTISDSVKYIEGADCTGIMQKKETGTSGESVTTKIVYTKSNND